MQNVIQILVYWDVYRNRYRNRVSSFNYDCDPDPDFDFDLPRSFWFQRVQVGL